MSIGGLGLPEILVILLLVFLLFGPKRLPELARSLGQGIREFKKSLASTTREMQDALDVKDEPQPDKKQL